MPTALPLPLQSRLLDALAAHAQANSEAAALFNDPEQLRTALVEVAHEHAVPVTSPQVERAVQQLMGPALDLKATTVHTSAPAGRPGSPAEREAWLARLNRRLTRAQEARDRHLRLGQRLSLHSSVGGAMLWAAVMSIAAWGMEVNEGVVWGTFVSLGLLLGLATGELFKHSRIKKHNRKWNLWIKHHRRLKSRIEGLASATPTAQDLDQWAQIPDVAALARSRLISPVGLLCQDVNELCQAYQTALPAHQKAQAAQKLQSFFEGAA